jgi:hypothetical protein
MKHPPIWGLLAEFEGPSSLVYAAERAHAEGFRKMDAYSPFPIEEASEAIGFHRTRLPAIILVGGLLGTLTGVVMQYWISAIDYPLNVGGRPLASWVAFVIPCFELTILFASFSAVVGMLALNGLPLPYHPVFNVAEFSRVSKDGFFLAIEATDPRFNLEDTRKFLQGLRPVGVWEVPH